MRLKSKYCLSHLYLRSAVSGMSRPHSDRHERQANHEMERIINLRPLKERMRKEMQEACDKLIKVNQPKPDGESANEFLVLRECQANPQNSECDMEYVVRSRGTRGAQLRWEHKAEDTNQNQHRRKDADRDLIEAR